MSERQEYRSVDPDSQKNQEDYHTLLDNIERRMDPNSNTVLVVDDSKMIRKMVAKNIVDNDERMVIYEAANGQEGLEALAEIREKYDRDPILIVTDLEMPVMDGWEFMDQLRRDYKRRGLESGVPLIVLSSSTGEKGNILFKKSVHGSKARYNPMVTIAKEGCVKPDKYNAKGKRGLTGWLKHFLRPSIR